jgi:hypothetical protein
MARRTLLIAIIALSAIQTSCGSGGPDLVSVVPAAATVAQGSTQLFEARIGSTVIPSASWSIAEGAAGGSLAAGLYTAPLTAGTYHVIATVPGHDPATAPVTVPAASVSVVPSQPTALPGERLRFRATVTGAPSQDVRWSLADPGAGVVDGDGFYTAPSRPGAYILEATSASGAGPAGEARITVVESLPGGTDLIEFAGPVVPSLRIYALWWGDPAAFPADAQSTIEALLRSLGGSPHLAIMDQYLFGARATTTFVRSLHDTRRTPPSPDPTRIEVSDEICAVLDEEGITPTENDIYVVYPSTPATPDTRAACGWHAGAICHNTNSFVAFVNSPAGSSGVCGSAALALDCSSTSAGTNLMTSTTLHEIMETITNGVHPTWVDRQGQEVADKCGPYAVCLPMGQSNFVVEPEYSNAHHGCVILP